MIWRFSEAPVLDHLNLSGDMDGGDMSAVMAQAEGVADHLQARQSVLAGVSGANFDPKQISELVTGDPALAARLVSLLRHNSCELLALITEEHAIRAWIPASRIADLLPIAHGEFVQI